MLSKRTFFNKTLQRRITNGFGLQNKVQNIQNTGYCCELPGLKTDVENIKRFDDIPGPKPLPFIGAIYKFMPYFGEYGMKTMYENSLNMYKKYGKLVRVQIFSHNNLVYVFDPDDIETVMRFSGKYPERKSHSALEYYRTCRPEKYNTAGLIPTNGEKWWSIRSKFQKPLSSPQSAAKYVPLTNNVVDEFIEKIREDYVVNKPYNGGDFLDYLSRVYLQMLLIIAFDAKQDTLSKEQFCPLSTSSKLIDCAEYANSITLKLDYLPHFYMKKGFKLYRNYERVIKHLEISAENFIFRKTRNINIYEDESEGKQPSLLEQYFANPDIDINDIVGMSVDLLLAGIDTTSYSSGFLLFHLAKNENIQEKLFQECLKILPKPNDKVTVETLGQVPYMKAVLKESLRMNPIAVGVGRMLTQDVVLSNYFVPKGSVIVTCNQVASKLPEYFDNPDQFIPERWFKMDENYKKPHPFASIPFGHGSRMCIARRLAEQNIYITIIKLIRNYKISWVGKDIEIDAQLINKPKHHIKLIFEPRI